MEERKTHTSTSTECVAPIYSTAIFDWDGTLVQSLGIWHKAAKSVTVNYGLTISDSEIWGSFGDFITHFTAWGIDDPETALSLINSEAAEGLESVEEYEGSLAICSLLKQRGIRLGLITSSSRNMLGRAKRHAGLLDLFDVTITGDDVENLKPSPEPYLTAFDSLKVQPHQAVVIGDNAKDIQGANAVGCDSVLFFPIQNYTFYDFGQLTSAKPTYVARSMTDVCEIVSKQKFC